MTTQPDDTDLELIDQLREAWTTDTERAGKILDQLLAEHNARAARLGWPGLLRERVRRGQPKGDGE